MGGIVEIKCEWYPSDDLKESALGHKNIQACYHHHQYSTHAAIRALRIGSQLPATDVLGTPNLFEMS